MFIKNWRVSKILLTSRNKGQGGLKKKKFPVVVFALEQISSDRLHPGYANFLN